MRDTWDYRAELAWRENRKEEDDENDDGEDTGYKSNNPNLTRVGKKLRKKLKNPIFGVTPAECAVPGEDPRKSLESQS